MRSAKDGAGRHKSKVRLSRLAGPPHTLNNPSLEGPVPNRKNELRHLMIQLLSEEWPRSPTGKRVKGFWQSASRELERIEGLEAPPGPELQTWWFKHRRICDAD